MHLFLFSERLASFEAVSYSLHILEQVGHASVVEDLLNEHFFLFEAVVFELVANFDVFVHCVEHLGHLPHLNQWEVGFDVVVAGGDLVATLLGILHRVLHLLVCGLEEKIKLLKVRLACLHLLNVCDRLQKGLVVVVCSAVHCDQVVVVFLEVFGMPQDLSSDALDSVGDFVDVVQQLVVVAFHDVLHLCDALIQDLL